MISQKLSKKNTKPQIEKVKAKFFPLTSSLRSYVEGGVILTTL
jgi:hypothetical protein